MIDPTTLLLLFSWATTPATSATPTPRWGGHGHHIAALVAVRTLPDSMPAFFRAAAEQLAYLNPEPDRWRDRTENRSDPAMGAVHTPEHYIDFELVPEGALDSENRFDYVIALARAGKDPEVVGLLPYRIIELAQLLRSGFRRWRTETDPAARRWIEQRILNDAGILGHYVTDGSNPHHTTMHHNGWVGENPRGFTAEPGFHGRFEGQFVEARITLDELVATATAPPRVFGSFRAATLEHLQTSHSHVVRLYELDKQRAFGAENDSPEHEQFALERLAAGATMLRDIWWTAWVTSVRTEGGRGRGGSGNER
jgi:hypothetical protein